MSDMRRLNRFSTSDFGFVDDLASSYCIYGAGLLCDLCFTTICMMILFLI
jgi:hypothetical protein